MGALALAGMGSRMVLSRLVARFGYPPVLVGSMVIPAVILPGVLVVSGDLALIGVMALAGLGLGLGQPISIVLVAVAAPRRSLGYAMSLRLVGNRLGQLTIPAVIGATAGSAGVAAIFLTVAGMLEFGALAVAADRRVPWGRLEAEQAAADSAAS